VICTCVTNNFKAVYLCLNDQIRLPCKKTRNGKCQIHRVLSYQFFSFSAHYLLVLTFLLHVESGGASSMAEAIY